MNQHKVGKPPWRNILDNDDHDFQMLAANKLPVPEPTHDRVSMLSTGASLRNKRRGTLNKIIEACKSYERRCEGKYSSNSLGTRYLFQLSKEIQLMVADIKQAFAKKKRRNRRNDMSEAYSDTEHEIFPHGDLSQTNDSAQNIDESNEWVSIENKPKLISRTNVVEALRKKNRELSRCLQQSQIDLQDLKQRNCDEMDENAALVRKQCRSEIDRLKLEYENEIKRLEQRCHNYEYRASSTIDLKNDNAKIAEKSICVLKAQLSKATENIAKLTEANLKLMTEKETLCARDKSHYNEWVRVAHSDASSGHNVEPRTPMKTIESPKPDIDQQNASASNELNLCISEPQESKIFSFQDELKGIKTENEYLRGRVKELYKMLFAFQTALAK